MVVVSITGILVAVSAPSLRPMMQRNAVAAQVNALTAAVRYARSEAIARGTPVSLCRADSTTSIECGGAAHDWGTPGFLVITDGGALGVVDGDDQVLRRFAPADAGIGIRASRGSAGTGFAAVSWGALGNLVARPSGTGMPQFRIRPDDVSGTSFDRRVCLSASGRPRLAQEDDLCDGN
jgi:type IV fimbrial biogenesis protein FimT